MGGGLPMRTRPFLVRTLELSYDPRRYTLQIDGSSHLQ